MKLTPSTKIVIGWALVISTGLFTFTVARDSVVKNRKSLMDIKKRIREQTEKEAELELLESKNAEMKNRT